MGAFCEVVDMAVSVEVECVSVCDVYVAGDERVRDSRDSRDRFSFKEIV